MMTIAANPPIHSSSTQSSSTHSSSTRSSLSLEAALASRIIRMGKIPRPLFQWLANPEQSAACDPSLANQRLTAALDEIVAPLLFDASQWEQKEARHAASWLGAICCTATELADHLRLSIGPRLVAASLLPLYRSLATGQLSEGLTESRMRLSELLTLLVLCYEVGNDLVRLLDPLNRRQEAPNKILATHFNLNLVVVAQVVREQLANFDPTTMQFSEQGVNALLQFDPQQSSCVMAEWAAPELLWRLSGELISKHTELVLPRAWIETAVPWHDITEHWQRLSLQLSAEVQKGKSVPASADIAALDGARSNTEAKRSSAAQLSAGAAEQAICALDELTDMLNTASHTTTPSGASALASQSCGSTPSTARADSAQGTDQQLTSSQATPPHLNPRVLIAEIRSHNDPIFVKVMRRQIVKCRSEARAVSLVSIVVMSEDGNDHHAVHENGLTLWQQRLVNWLAEHPQVVEPHAFLTSEGQLLLCLLDLERNETTSLIRHGLVEVLTGRQLDDSRGDLLARVHVPARYHAGISSTSSPGANFTAEQLIAPAIRCLSAASLHGKASIKSIEVY